MAQPGTAAALSDRRWVILSVVAVAQLMVVLDATIVNIALPSAQRALGFADSDRQWVVTAYALAFGSLLLEAAGPATCTTASGSSSRATTANHNDQLRSSAMTNGPAHSRHQAVPGDDPKRPPLDEAARRAFIARSAALAPHYRTEFLLAGAAR
jgi:uncharacterized protein (DUF1778 family)